MEYLNIALYALGWLDFPMVSGTAAVRIAHFN